MSGAVTAVLLLGVIATVGADTPNCPDDYCCNGTRYEYQMFICCDNVRVLRPDNAECCGRQAYDSLRKICCDNALQDRPNNAECCGKRAYDTKIQKCCNGRVLAIKEMLYQEGKETGKGGIKEGFYKFLPCVECCGDGIMPVNPDVICCDGVQQQRPPNGECCGEKAYDSTRQICCGGQVVEKIKYQDEYLQELNHYLSLFGITIEDYAEKHGVKLDSMLPCLGCCGDKPYQESDDKICCDGVLQPKPPNGECCGRRAIDTVRLICCDGVAQLRPPNADCCGRRTYNRLAEKCCRNETTVETTTAEETTAIDTSSTTTETTTTVTDTLLTMTPTPKPHGGDGGPCDGDLCCNSEPYDIVKYICCNDIRYPRPDNGKCCGPEPYNELKEICCDKQLQERPANAKCCKDRAYDSLLQMCCNGEIIDKREFQYEHFGKLIDYLALFGVSIEKYVPDDYKKKIGLVSCLDCCGKRVYIASASEICCEGILYQKPDNGECCGGKPINSVEMICCDGLAQYRPPDAACCGRQAYDTKQQYCCSGEIRDIEDKPPQEKPSNPCVDDQCCKDKPYDYHKEICCDDILYPRPDNGKCCGSKPYNELKEICCDKQLQTRPANAKCCGHKAYNSKKQLCCHFKITDRYKFNEIYLEKLRNYLAAFDIVLEWYLDKHDIKPMSLMTCLDCCGDQVYFKTDDKICCAGELQARPPNAECCGPEPINAATTICCDGPPQPRPDNAACCGQKAYNRRWSYCCSKKLFKKK